MKITLRRQHKIYCLGGKAKIKSSLASGNLLGEKSFIAYLPTWSDIVKYVSEYIIFV